MKELILLVGPPGSGKSTFCTKLNHIRISQDDQGKKEHLGIFTNALASGVDIVVDRMNFNKQQRNRYLEPALSAGYKTKIVVFHVPLKTCLERCNKRKNHPTIKDEKTASKAVNLFFKNYERVEDNEADTVIRLGWEKYDRPEAIVCDIDGTMANIEHRRKHLIPKEGKKRGDWGRFFKEMTKDSLNQWCADITQLFASQGTPIVFATGRPDDYHEQTYNWLYKHKLIHDHLFMRLRGDFRKDDIVKEIILEFEILPRYNVKFVIDDRQQVVDMWRKNGHVVLQCDKGDF